MKTLTSIIFFFVSITIIHQTANAMDITYHRQNLTDTTDFFPNAVGNYWEYKFDGFWGTIYYTLSVVKDSVLSNGTVYKVFKEVFNFGSYDYIYYRKEDDNVFQYYGDSTACPTEEFINWNFSVKDSTVWQVCRDLGPCGNAKGVSETFYDSTYYSFFYRNLETKHFQDVLIDSGDTVWTPCDGREYWISKSLGIVRIFIFNLGDFRLEGAIIDGVKYGTLVSVRENSEIQPSTFKIEAYPNPFNSEVNFNYDIPEAGISEISIYNSLGQKVETIHKEFKGAGSYQVRYNSTSLPSGVYFAVLSQSTKSTVLKLILLK